MNIIHNQFSTLFRGKLPPFPQTIHSCNISYPISLASTVSHTFLCHIHFVFFIFGLNAVCLDRVVTAGAGNGGHIN